MITIKYCSLDRKERQEKTLDFSRNKSIKEYIVEFGYKPEDFDVIVSGKRVSNIERPIDNGDEIIITPKIEGAIGAAIWGFFAGSQGHLWAFIVGVAKAIAVVGRIVTAAISVFSRPRTPTFDTHGDGIDENSPTYGWEGIQTVQEVGIPVPIIYGEHRVGGNVLNAYVRTDGDNNYLNVLLGLCEGEVEDISDITINDNLFTNFDDVTSFTQYGTNSQSVIANFEDAHNLYAVNVNLNTQSATHTYTTVDSDVEGFEIYLQCVGGLFQANSNGGVLEWSVTYQVEYKIHTDPSYTDLGTTTITEKNRTTVRRVYRKVGLTAGQYDIRVTRTSEASSLTPVKQGDLTWSQVDEIKTDDYAYPNTALLGIEALATDQLSGSMPNFTILVKGKKISAPNILNGASPVDWEDYYYDDSSDKWRLLSDDTELVWSTGDYTTCYCANPIWCLKDLLLSTRYGLGEYIETADIDNDLWIEMAKYCEEKVPDGDGGYEKRFRLDVVIDSGGKALDIIMQLCATFRGLPFYSEGKVKFRIDKEETPVQLFTMGNMIEGSFVQSWKSIKDVPNVINVQFLDKDKDYRQDTVSYIDEEAVDAGDPLRIKDIRLFATSISQVLREARYALKVMKYVRRTVQFKVGIDGIACQAGDVISVAHDVTQWGYSGRVIDGSTTTSIKIDREITFEWGITYKMMIRFADDTIEERTVTNGLGTFSTITVSSAFSQTPAEYDVYSVGEVDKHKKDYRILSLQRSGTNEVEIVAFEYNEGVYDDSAITLPINNYSMLSLSVPQVTDLSLTERLVKLPDGTIENCIDVWFNAPALPNYVRQYYKGRIYISENDTGVWRYIGETTTRQYQILGDLVEGTTYYVKVISVSNDGAMANFASAPSSSLTLVGKSANPSDVTGFLVNQNRDRIKFSWTEIDDVDNWGYEIRWGTSWVSSELVAMVQGNSYLSTNFRTGTSQSYWIKALDTSGNYSETATEAVITVDNIPFRNIIESYSEQTAWTGSKSNTETSGDNLIISDGYTSGTYTTAQQDIGYVATFYIGIDVVVAVSTGRAFDDDVVTTFQTYPDLRFSGTEAPASATFEIKTSEDGSNWTDWTGWQAGDYKCRYFQLRMTLTRDVITDNLQCSQFDYYADLPDVDEFGTDSITTADSGRAVVFTKTFHEEPNVHIEVTSGSGVYHLFTAKSTTGFTVKLYDLTATVQTGDFDWHAHGI